MIHEMRLQNLPFQQIVSDPKTIEVRLYDRKRQKIDIGDVIIFYKLENWAKKLAAKVSALYRYSNFEEMFLEIPPEKCGFPPCTTAAEAAIGMRAYYSDADVQLNGVLGIRLARFDLAEAIQMQKRAAEAKYEELFPDGMK